MKKKNTIIISAMFCCGKTYLYRNQTKYSIIDLDEELDPKPKGNESKKVRDIMKKDYISKIKECLGLYDFIFIAPRPHILQGLVYNHIPYISVCPKNTPECFKEWERRNMERCSMWLWNACKNHWHYLLKKMMTDKSAKAVYTLNENEYLSDIIDQIYSDQNKDKGEETC